MIQRQLSFQEAIKIVLTEKYCCFTGRASRSEYWWWVLFTALIGFVMGFVMGFVFNANLEATRVVSWIVNLALFLPGLGLCMRRLHDIGKSGWWLLIGLIPVVGLILLIVWFCQPSQPGENQYGEEPYMIM